MTELTITVELPDDYAAVVLDEDADMNQELADLLRFRIAKIVRLEWRDAAALVAGAEEVQP